MAISDDRVDQPGPQRQATESPPPGCPECAKEPTEEELLNRLDAVIAGMSQEPGDLIPILQVAQSLFGYLPESALRHISRKLRIPFSEVSGVVTFYSYFTTTPRGKHVVRVCLGTACYVRGGKQILDEISEQLGVQIGQVTADRLFSLEVGRCFGACGMAPVVMIDDTVHQRVKPNKVSEILNQYRQREVGEQNEQISAANAR